MQSPTIEPFPEAGLSTLENIREDKSPKQKLVLFLLGIFFLLGALECLVRCNAALFEGASHRALAKLAMFGKHPDARYVFLGTSRTQDGVSPVLVTRALGELAPRLGNFPGYNAAFTGSSLDALTSLAPRFFRTNLNLVIVELSQPQIANEPAPWVSSSPSHSSASFEDQLSDVSRHIDFIRYRTAFRTENLGRLPALLLFSSSLSGWETKGKDQVASWLGRKEESAVTFDNSLWKPEIITHSETHQSLNAANEKVATELAALSKLFLDQRIKVVFVVPPLSQAYQANAPETKLMRDLFADLAHRTRCEVWNFASLALPDSFFRDPSHLGKEGRAHYSRALAEQIGRSLSQE